jgi:transcriptional regulator with XRE-family HTH domain
MGKSPRSKPKYLAGKLLQIRQTLDLSQNEMLERLGLKESHFRSNISAFERGIREPSYIILLRYATVAGICTDVLINDNLELPEKLPAVPRH